MINTAAVIDSQDPKDTDENTTVIRVPMELKRRGRTMRLIVQPAGGVATMGSLPNLVARIAKAHEWFAQLSSGRSNSTQAIELEEKVSSTHMARVLYLAFLAPDIVERIIRGNLPLDFDTGRLMRLTPLPLDWDDQRVLLGLKI